MLCYLMVLCLGLIIGSIAGFDVGYEEGCRDRSNVKTMIQTIKIYVRANDEKVRSTLRRYL